MVCEQVPTSSENNDDYAIVNALGQKVASGIIDNDRIAITTLQKGIYFLDVVAADKTIVAKFVKE